MQIKRLLTATVALLLLAAGCSNEEIVRQTDGSLFGTIPEGMIEYQFTLSGITPNVSYAETRAMVQMTDNEMMVEDLTVFVCEEKGDDLAQADAAIFGIYDAKVKNNKASILIKKDDLTGFTSDKIRFVLVANKKWTSLAWNWDEDPDSETENVPITIADKYSNIKEIMSVAMVIPASMAGSLSSGYPKGGLPMYAEIKNVDKPVAGDVLHLSAEGAKLTRPVARIDICNNAVKYLTITNLCLCNLREMGMLFDPADRSSDADMEMDADESLYAFWNDIEFKGYDGMGYVEGVFYPYPSDANEGVELHVRGSLILPGGGGAQNVTYDLPIKVALDANKRYKLNLKMNERDGLDIDVSYIQNEWGEGSPEGEDADMEHNVVAMPVVTDANLKAVSGKTGEYIGIAGTEIYTMNFMGGTGSEVMVKDEDGVDNNIFVSATPANTRVANFKTWTIMTTTGTAGVAKFKLMSSSEGDATEIGKYSITVPRANEWVTNKGIILTGVTVGNLLWAPANVGAESTGETGSFYQWGRNFAWKDITEVRNSTHSISELDSYPTPVEAETKYAGLFLAYGDASGVWWNEKSDEVDAMVKKWNTVSDGSSNPCPKGWRLPAMSEYKTLGVNLGEAENKGNNISIRTAQNVIFPIFKTINGSYVVENQAYYFTNHYEGAVYAITLLTIDDKVGGCRMGGHIRCVKDVAVP